MTHYKPCFNCAADKDACDRREVIKSAIAGAGVTAINFRCDGRQSRFRRGQRVEFDWLYWEDGDSRQGYTATFHGTIMGEKRGNRRFNIRVDPEGEFYDIEPAELLRSQFISVRPDDIRALDEPDRDVCLLCGAYSDMPDDIALICYDQSFQEPRCLKSRDGTC